MWRDRTYGNSYGSARLYGDGQLLHVIPFQYGQVSHFEWTASRLLGSDQPLSYFCRENGHTLTQDVSHVTKREAENHGNS